MTPIVDDIYDEALHGDKQAPAAQRGMAIAVVLAIVGLPFVVWLALAWLLGK